MTSCIYQTTIEAFTSSSVWNSVAQSADQTLVSQQSGIGSFLVWIAVIIGALVILGIIGAVIYLVYSSKQPKDTSLTDALSALGQKKPGAKTSPVSSIIPKATSILPTTSKTSLLTTAAQAAAKV